MRRFIILGILVSLSGGMSLDSALAQDRKGAPSELLGYFGKRPTQCQSYHRKIDEITIINPGTITWCGGSACEARIASHRKTKDGYILKLQSANNPNGWTSAFKIIDHDTIEELGEGTAKTETLVRCSARDQIAGIGRDTVSPGLTKSLDTAFSAYYALALPEHCKDIEVDRKKAEQLIELATLTWVQFILDTQKGRQSAQDAARTVKRQQISAESAAQQDATEIKGFCEHAADAFGSGGRVVPDLVKDRRKKA
jgi:hypothetical protein